MNNNLEQHIRDRAYFMWIEAGRPIESPEVFWLAAQREMLSSRVEEPASPISTKLVKTKSKSKSKRAA